MASDRRTDEVNEHEVRAQLLAEGWCPNHTDPEAPMSKQRRTLVDHCAIDIADARKRGAKPHRPCLQGWLTCTECGAYGTTERFTGPDPLYQRIELPSIDVDELRNND